MSCACERDTTTINTEIDEDSTEELWKSLALKYFLQAFKNAAMALKAETGADKLNIMGWCSKQENLWQGLFRHLDQRLNFSTVLRWKKKTRFNQSNFFCYFFFVFNTDHR